jgi:hypothetical protein
LVRAARGGFGSCAATAVLLEGLEVGPNGPVTETTTPTGAVLLGALGGAPPARWRPLTAGAWGAAAVIQGT